MYSYRFNSTTGEIRKPPQAHFKPKPIYRRTTPNPIKFFFFNIHTNLQLLPIPLLQLFLFFSLLLLPFKFAHQFCFYNFFLSLVLFHPFLVSNFDGQFRFNNSVHNLFFFFSNSLSTSSNFFFSFIKFSKLLA